MYCDCYSISSSFLLTRNKGVACSYGSKLGAEIILSFLREPPSFSRKCCCKLCCYKWCVSPQDIPVSKYEVTKCSLRIQWRQPMGMQTVKDVFLKSEKINGTLKRELKWTGRNLLRVILKNQKLIMNRAFTQETGGGQQTHSTALQLNV